MLLGRSCKILLTLLAVIRVLLRYLARAFLDVEGGGGGQTVPLRNFVVNYAMKLILGRIVKHWMVCSLRMFF